VCIVKDSSMLYSRHTGSEGDRRQKTEENSHISIRSVGAMKSITDTFMSLDHFTDMQ